ncbi:MAG: DUF4190 domain-containing protein [Gemmataceae bacterium]|nr:DUF4190 domain-containing protein [Gemmataceae bacterium]
MPDPKREPMLPPPPAYIGESASDETDLGEDAMLRMIVPVGRSGWAIAAGYLGLISVLVIPAPFAVITGILAVREIQRDPKKHGMGRAIFGLVMGGLFSVFLALMIVVGVVEALRKR